jgi:hypothetical protein
VLSHVFRFFARAHSFLGLRVLVVKAIRRNFADPDGCLARKPVVDLCLLPRVELRVKIRQVVKAKYLPICDFEEYSGTRIAPAGAQPAQFSGFKREAYLANFG